MFFGSTVPPLVGVSKNEPFLATLTPLRLSPRTDSQEGPQGGPETSPMRPPCSQTLTFFGGKRLRSRNSGALSPSSPPPRRKSQERNSGEDSPSTPLAHYRVFLEESRNPCSGKRAGHDQGTFFSSRLSHPPTVGRMDSQDFPNFLTLVFFSFTLRPLKINLRRLLHPNANPLQMRFSVTTTPFPYDRPDSLFPPSPGLYQISPHYTFP